MSRPLRREFRPHCEPLDERRLLSVVSPTQMRHAYGADATGFSFNGQAVPANGAGQIVAVVVAYHDPYLSSDVQTFDAAYGLANPWLGQVNLAGGATNDGWAGEEAMDVEWAHAMAPGAGIVVVEARSDSLGDLLTAVNVARQLPGVSVVSMSWGGSEFPGESAFDGHFTTPAGHTGVTFVTASGDSGAGAGAEWPAASPNVVAVGGTTLWTDVAGDNLAETAWYGSGGGVSRYEAEPAYQTSAQLTGRRTTPDVSLDADPNTGVAVYATTPSTGQGTWGIYGGTSLSAQLFAGIVAIANEGRALAGEGSLDGPTQTLPALYAAPSGTLRDVTRGSNGYWAWTGYDLATGLGTANVASLAPDLVQAGAVAPVSTRAAVSSPRFGTRAARPAVSAASTAAAPSASETIGPAIEALPPEVALAPGPGWAMSPPSLTAGRRTGADRLDAVDRAIDELVNYYLWN